MAYWTALRILQQASGELGLPVPQSIVTSGDIQTSQMLALLNSAGNELLLYYPWQQFATPLTINTVAGQENYPLPADLQYITDQTQWDTTNRWPLLGPKSPQEWAWLKNSFVASLPRMRFRIQNNVLKLFPVPTATSTSVLSFEYISSFWVNTPQGGTGLFSDTVLTNTDVVMYDPWLIVKFIKFKFYELKGFATTGVQADFMRVFDSLTGKDTGAEKLNLAPGSQSPYIGVWSIPDGSWQV